MNDLIYKYQQGQDVFEEILKKVSNLMYKTINRYPTNVMYSKEDKYQVAQISLMKALKSFDITKNIKFSTYLTRIVTNDMNTIFRKTKKRDENVNSLDEKLDTENNFVLEDTLTIGNNVEEYIESKCETEFMKECLSEYKVKYAKKYESAFLILQGYTHREVEKMTSYGRTQCGNNYKHFLEFSRKKAIELGLINI
jgi:RNA polymerase sporulation-specific sigma factor